jgi:hypothetical protein
VGNVAQTIYKARNSRGGGHPDRATLGEEAAARLAAFHLDVRRAPGLAGVLGTVARRSRGSIVADVGLATAGLALGRAWLVLIGVALLAFTFGAPCWRHRFSPTFDRLQRAMALGQWAEAARLLARFSRGRHPDTIERSLKFHDAQIHAQQGEPLQPLLARLALDRDRMPPAIFQARLAAVHAAAKDYDGTLACMRAAWEAAPDDPAIRVDYALAHARLGDLVRAQELLDAVDMEALPVQGRPVVWWARGLVELRNGKASAQETLLEGLEGLLLAPTTPANWHSLALCSGAWALALQRAGDAGTAKRLVSNVWPVLKVCADTRLRGEIEREIGPP